MANTTSSAYAFDQNFSIDEIIADAYERLGLVGTAGHQIKTARRSLNILFQEWGNRGIHFWEVGNTNVNLVVGSSTNVDATAEGSGVYTFYRNASDIPGGNEPPQATTKNIATVNKAVDTNETKLTRDARLVYISLFTPCFCYSVSVILYRMYVFIRHRIQKHNKNFLSTRHHAIFFLSN